MLRTARPSHLPPPCLLSFVPEAQLCIALLPALPQVMSDVIGARGRLHEGSLFLPGASWQRSMT